MYESLEKKQEDQILQTISQFREDTREHKCDLGVGVYRNSDGATPVMRSIKEAERRLWDLETTKGYTPQMVGETRFLEGMRQLLLGKSCPPSRVAQAATTGGTGAVRQGLELTMLANPTATVWVSSPTWVNHVPILEYLKLSWAQYRYYDEESRSVDFAAMLADLEQAKPGDVVLLHGCCHNPTGADLSQSRWQELARLIETKGLLPFVDIAYQGFGAGLDDDAYGVRLLASTLPEVLIAASCSKNFGIYRERAGILVAVANDVQRLEAVSSTLSYLNRIAYSFPPDHGARLVGMVLEDSDLRVDWEQELAGIRQNVACLRSELAGALRDLSGSDRFGFLSDHNGMFSLLGATPDQVAQLRDVHAIYMAPDSRINVAGLTQASIPLVAQAIIEVGI